MRRHGLSADSDAIHRHPRPASAIEAKHVGGECGQGRKGARSDERGERREERGERREERGERVGGRKYLKSELRGRRENAVAAATCILTVITFTSTMHRLQASSSYPPRQPVPPLLLPTNSHVRSLR
eukprot:768701-Hanusia_phi.AAC.10